MKDNINAKKNIGTYISTVSLTFLIVVLIGLILTSIIYFKDNGFKKKKTYNTVTVTRAI